MSVLLATVSSLHEVAVRRSHCLLIRCIHCWVILLVISGGIAGQGTTRELSGVCSLTWHGDEDRQA
jgi:hypothetical protein